VLAASHGLQALEQMRRKRPDLVLVDARMPVMDGPALLRAMNQDSLLATIPTVLMSYNGESAVEQSEPFGPIVLSKSRLVAELTDTIRGLRPSPDT